MSVHVHDVVVVGAGAAGVGVANLLDGTDVVVLDRRAAPGDVWRERYERLHLHTARRLSHVAGGRVPKVAGGGFVPAAAYADHVAQVAAASGADVRCGVTVERVERDGDGALLVRTDAGDLRARQVVLATGQNDVPVVPELPGRERFDGDVLHADEYRSGAAFAGRRVVVVGTGNTGTELAQDLVEQGAASVTVAMRNVPRIVPRKIGPASAHALAWLLVRLVGVGGMRRVTGLMGKAKGRRLTPLGLYPPTGVGRGVPTLDHGFVAQVRAGKVRLAGAAEAFEAGGLRTADGELLACDVVVFCTGYRPNAVELLAPELLEGRGDVDLADPASLADLGIWFVGFGPAPVGQLVLARGHAQQVARTCRTLEG